MQDYAYSPTSNGDIDVKIAENKNKIQKLSEEIKELELAKSKSNKQYVGRCFAMDDGEYILVTGLDWDGGKPYGISFEFFEYSSEISTSVIFNESKVEKEITIDELRYLLNKNSKIDKIVDVLGYK